MTNVNIKLRTKNHNLIANGINAMYDKLINGKQAAEKHYNDGETIQVVRRGVWYDMTESDKHLFASDLFIFRVKPEKINEMLNQIQANRVSLDNCPRHKFELGEPPYQIGEKVQCLRCGGFMSLTSVGEYVRGYVAASGDPDDIVKNWYGDSVSKGLQWYNLTPVTCPHCKGYGDNRHELGKPFKHCCGCHGVGSVPRCNAVLMMRGNRDL